MLLSECVQPVDIGGFMENKKVIEQIEKSKETVVISGDSDPGLIAGNGKISGLNPNKYYRIEELYENGSLKYTDFVTAKGELSGSIESIKKGASEITGLTNFVTYRVKSAVPFANGSLGYFNLTTDTAATPATITNGTVTIYGDLTNYYLNLAPTIAPTKYYEVMKIPIAGSDPPPWDAARTSAFRKGANPVITYPLPEMNDTDYKRFNDQLNIGIYEYDPAAPSGYTGTITPAFLANMSITALPVVDTENDYVFVEYTSETATKDFLVLRVSRKRALGGATVTITPPGVPADNAPVLLKPDGSPLTPGGYLTVSLGDTNTTIQISNYSGYSDVQWYYDDNVTPITQLTASELDISASPLNAAGKYTITVTGTVGGVDYSTWFYLTVTP